MKKFFGKLPSGEETFLYTISRNGITATVTDFGATLVNVFVPDADGNIAELRCTADLETGNGNPADGRKVKGTIHWVSAKYAEDITLRQYANLLTLENPADLPEGKTFNDYIDPNSLVVVEHAKAEPALRGAIQAGNTRFQFVRDGYYVADAKLPNTFNRTVGLKDSFPKNN